MNGNILSVTKNGENEKTYSYTDSNWKDKLTAYNGTPITYDAIGNPLQYRDNINLTWANGRKLASFTKDNKTTTFSYDGDGNRIRKQLGNDVVDYTVIGGVIYAETRRSIVTNDLHFLFDENGNRIGFVHNGTNAYYYRFNLQGDVIGIFNESGTLVVEYAYDAWGKLEDMTGNTLIGLINPIRYRGYYYDIETGFYYLQSRYYDPETGRFISPDAYLSTGQGVLGSNMYAYCLNNPIRYADPTGTIVIEVVVVECGLYVAIALVLVAMVFDPDVNAAIQNGIDEFWNNTVNFFEFTKYNFASDIVVNYVIPKVSTKEKSSVKEKEVEIIKTSQSKTTTTYYHLTTPEYALILQYSPFLQGSILEGGYVFAWKMKPNTYAIQNSGARGTVLISFETTAAFEIDSGISDPRVMRYGPVRSVLSGPIPISNVQIVGGKTR